MATTIEELQVLITGQTAGLIQELQKVKKQLHVTQKDVRSATGAIASSFRGLAKLAGFTGIIAGVAAVGVALKSGAKVAMHFEASLQQVTRMMGSSTQAFKRWANENAISFGMSRVEAMRYGAVYANLISVFTKSTAETTQYTQDLLKTSAIIASATGRTMTDTIERIRSGLLGNTEAIEDLGVYVNIAMIESTNAFKKFANGRSWGKLDFQTQQQIRLFAILEQAAAKYGVEIVNNTAFRQQQFIAQLKNVQLSLGQAFLPIYNAILPALTALAQALASIMQTVAQFMQSLFGTAKATTQVGTQAIQAQTAAVNKLGNAYDKAGKKAKASAGSVAGFDEVNRLAEADQATAGGGGGGADPTDAGTGVIPTPVIPEIDTDMIPKQIQLMADKVKQILATVFKPIQKSWRTYEPALTAAFKQAKESWANIWRGTTDTMAGIWKNGGAQVVEHVTSFVLALGVLALRIHNEFIMPVIGWFVDQLNPQTNTAMQGIINVVNKLLASLVKFVTYLSGDGFGYVQIALGGVAGALVGLAVYKTITGIIVFVKELATTVRALFAVLAAHPIMAVMMAIGALVGALITAYNTNDDFRKTVDAIWDKMKNFLIPIFETTKQVCIDLWNNVLVPLGAFLMEVFVASWDAVVKVATFLWDEVLTPFGKFLQQFWESVLQPIATILSDVLAVAFHAVSEVVKILWQEVLVPLGSFFIEVFKLAIQAVIDILTHWWQEVLKPIAEFLGKTFSPVLKALIAVYQFLWHNVLKPLVKFLLSVFLTAFKNVSKNIGEIIRGIKKIFEGLIDFIVGIFTGDWKKAWEGVKKIFKGIFESLWGIVKVPLNLIIKGINWLIDGLNKIHFKLPKWDILGEYAGKDFGIHIPHIQPLARGGIVDSPTIAMIGEAGKEAVIPLENTSFVNTIASAIGSSVLAAQQMANSGRTQSSNEGGDIVIQVDGTTLARVLNPYLSQEQQRIGATILKPI